MSESFDLTADLEFRAPSLKSFTEKVRFQLLAQDTLKLTSALIEIASIIKPLIKNYDSIEPQR